MLFDAKMNVRVKNTKLPPFRSHRLEFMNNTLLLFEHRNYYNGKNSYLVDKNKAFMLDFNEISSFYDTGLPVSLSLGLVSETRTGLIQISQTRHEMYCTLVNTAH